MKKDFYILSDVGREFIDLVQNTLSAEVQRGIDAEFLKRLEEESEKKANLLLQEKVQMSGKLCAEQC